eukprot:CAMPEP_0196709666 /NCGR_PEP_ID=MMETSP1090-20130531/68521_2 /TAXON_ID=37098 /ORGANISM="Isochrysis sp, Strain CCMP1244" /LENGTH=92 /DNA_ID=CAMNT_0042049679 /DNA_START=1 /DNA_END=276 /DNA_ORIENTATION=-
MALARADGDASSLAVDGESGRVVRRSHAELGGATESYEWEQSGEEVTVRLRGLPRSLASSLRVRTTSDSLEVRHGGGELLRGKLHAQAAGVA